MRSLLEFALFVCFCLVQVCHGSELITQSGFVINKESGVRVHLKCVNWYGAHSNLFVVHGLETRSLKHLVNKLVESRANCVRIPVSNDLSNLNPSISRDAIAAMSDDECPNATRALDVMDCVVNEIQKRKIYVIFNNHCSWPAWVGGPAFSQQGLWHFPSSFKDGNYTFEKWVQSMEILVLRYNMTGIDIRNEIHDQDNVRITWGESENFRTDWLAASSIAAKRLHQIDNTLLIFVGGLCYNFDLRAMMKKVGPTSVFDKHKLIYTTHVYSWSFWWNQDTLKLLNATALLLSFAAFLCGLTLYYNYFNYLQYRVLRAFEAKDCNLKSIHPLEIMSSSCSFHLAWLLTSVVFYFTSLANGCSTIADDALWLVMISMILLSTTVTMALCHRRCTAFLWHTFWGLCLMWLGLFFLIFFFVTLYLLSPQSYDDFFKLWALDNRPVPVWVGEFGDSVAQTNRNHAWNKLWTFISMKYDLDFAYWCFNGRKWINGRWEDEGFGLLAGDYSTWRNLAFNVQIFSNK